MWIKKEVNEINIKTRTPIYKYVLMFSFLLILQITLYKFFGESHRFQLGIPQGSVSWDKVIDHIPKYLFSSAIYTFGVFFLTHLLKKQSKRNGIKYVCKECNTLSKVGGKCKCGADYIDIDLMMWVED